MKRTSAALVSLALVMVGTEARADNLAVLPTARLSFGFALHADKGRIVPAFAFEVDTGVGLSINGNAEGFGDGGPQFFVAPELGYTLDSRGTHAFNLGLPIGGAYYANSSGNGAVGATYDPRLILGTNNGDFAVGMRNAAALRLFRDFVDIEAGHQFTVTKGIFDHAFIMLGGINIPGFLYLIPTG